MVVCLTQGVTFIPPVDPRNCHSLFKSNVALWSSLYGDKVSFLCNSGQSHPALFPDLHRHITLAHLYQDFFHCKDLLVSHKPLKLFC